MTETKIAQYWSTSEPVDHWRRVGWLVMVLAQVGQVSYIDHVGVVVADADVAAASLSARLGLQVVHDEVLDQVGVRLVHLAGSDGSAAATIQLVQPVAAGPIHDFLSANGEGPHHVCFAVGDLAQFLAHPDEAGTRSFTGGRGRQACFLAGRPAGIHVELMQVRADADAAVGADPGGA